jgi:glyoxylase-like metal-dependent hydrolase (beta-lactamase superfamily II)
VRAIDRHGFQLQAIACTHAHLDHIGGVMALKQRKPQASVIISRPTNGFMTNCRNSPYGLAFPARNGQHLALTSSGLQRSISTGRMDRSEAGELHHHHPLPRTPGHVVLFEPTERKVFVGDVLFAGSIGRTDLPGGSSAQLMDSIINKLLPLGDDVVVYSGHGPTTTIGAERRTNPFLAGVHSLGRGTRF